MADGEEITLEGQAVDEILREARRSKELINDFGLYGGRRKNALPNKRFLNNTLVSTLRHSYREEKKHREGSSRKFHQHINKRQRRGRHYYRNQGDREEIIEPDNGEPEPDYGEFDAIAYTEKCTDLYIRDSHRKHSFMRGNFVEKRYKGSSSESEESFTEYDEPPTDKWKHDKFEGKWLDTGSADEYASEPEEKSGVSDNEELNDKDKPGKSSRHIEKYSKKKVVRKIKRSGGKAPSKTYSRDRSYLNAGTSKDDWSEENFDGDFTGSPKKKVKRGTQGISDTDEHSEGGFMNSGTESADNMEKPKKHKGKGKKTRKLPYDGKELWEKISSKSMYADIEEMKMKKSSQNFSDDNLDLKEDRKYPKQIKTNERKQKYQKQKMEEERDEEEMKRIADWKRKEEEMRDEAERERKEESKRRLAERKMKENEMRLKAERQEEHQRRAADMHYQEEQMRRAAFEYFRGAPQRRPFRGRPFMRPGPFVRGRPPRGFRGGLPMFPPINPFYASLFYEMDPYLLEKFIKEHGHRLLKKYRRHSGKSRSRSRSHSKRRSGKYKKKRRHDYSDSDSSYSRDRSKSRSRRHSSRRSYSRSHSRDRSRSYSRDRSKSYSRDHSRSYSRDNSRIHSRSRRKYSSSDSHSRSRSRGRSRRKSRSRSEYRKRSHSYESSRHSSYEDSHRSHSHSSRKHKKHHKHKKSKHRKHSKSNHKSRKSSRSESEDEKNIDKKSKGNEETDDESDDSESEISDVNEEGQVDAGIGQDEASEGEIMSDDNGGLESVSEEDGEAWSSSTGEEGAIETD